MYFLFVFVTTLVVLNLVDAAQLIERASRGSDCDVYSAICRLHNGTVSGTIRLRRPRSSVNAPVIVTGEISGLTAGQHGFHLQEFGDLSGGCAGTGGHYNPYGKTHGAPTDENRHVGDLGNIVAGSDGRAQVDISDSQLKLCGPHSILGRAIVIHTKRDDLGQGGSSESLRTGNAGGHVGCCVIAAAGRRYNE